MTVQARPVVYQKLNPATRKLTKVVIDDDTGLPLIVSYQNTRAIVEDAKRQASMFDPLKPTHGHANWTQVASIPAVLWQRLRALGIAQDPVALKQWLSRRDARFFRTDDGRRLA